MADAHALFDRLLDAVRTGGDVAALVTGDLGPSDAADLVAPIAMSPGLTVTWSGVNGSRVDCGLASTDDREWRVVYTTDDGEHMGSLHVIQRPDPFPGVPGGRAVVVHGPSSAGKSSLMTAISFVSRTPWVMFDEASFGSHPIGYAIWPETAPTLRPGFLAGIAALATAGNQVISSSARHPQDEWRQVFGAAGVPVLFVGLECPMDVLVDRQGGRFDRWGGLAESCVDYHAGWEHDLVLDSSTMTPHELAGAVVEAWTRASGGRSPR